MKTKQVKPVRVERGEILKNMREIDEQMHRQEELAARSRDKSLDEYDKTLADSFPTSDPPQTP